MPPNPPLTPESATDVEPATVEERNAPWNEMLIMGKPDGA